MGENRFKSGAAPANYAIVANRRRPAVLLQIRPITLDPEDTVGGLPAVRVQHTARPVREHQIDEYPLMVAGLIAHNLRFASGRLNHVRAQTFGGKLSCLEWSRSRTNQRQCQVDAIDPEQT